MHNFNGPKIYDTKKTIRIQLRIPTSQSRTIFNWYKWCVQRKYMDINFSVVYSPNTRVQSTFKMINDWKTESASRIPQFLKLYFRNPSMVARPGCERVVGVCAAPRFAIFFLWVSLMNSCWIARSLARLAHIHLPYHQPENAVLVSCRWMV